MVNSYELRKQKNAFAVCALYMTKGCIENGTNACRGG